MVIYAHGGSAEFYAADVELVEVQERVRREDRNRDRDDAEE
jgi:hypothetical protein